MGICKHPDNAFPGGSHAESLLPDESHWFSSIPAGALDLDLDL